MDINRKSLNEKCYVVYATNMKPLKVRGITNKKRLLKTLRRKGFAPKSVVLNSKSRNTRNCKSNPTNY